MGTAGKKRAKKKTAAKTTGKRAAVEAALPVLIPQPNGGALKSGGTPGNAGGTGRPPSAIRERLRGSYEERIALLEQFADGKFVPAMPPAAEAMAKMTEGDDASTNVVMAAYAIGDRLKALDQMAKYGLGTTTTQTDTKGADVAAPGRLTPEQRRAEVVRLLMGDGN